jgi:hypothetical protein
MDRHHSTSGDTDIPAGLADRLKDPAYAREYLADMFDSAAKTGAWEIFALAAEDVLRAHTVWDWECLRRRKPAISDGADTEVLPTPEAHEQTER